MLELLIALVAMISAWFHPVVPAPAPEPPAVVTTIEAAPVTPEPTPEAPAATTEAPETSSEAPAPSTEAPAPDPTTEATTEEPAANWMEAAQVQVDPNGWANWHFYRNGAWGASDGWNIYIDPNSPVEDHLSIMYHEMGHVLQNRYYGNLFDAPDMEHQADCIARLEGAIWLNYGCPPELEESAQAVLKGK